MIRKYFKNFLFFYRRLRNRMSAMLFLTLLVGLLDGMGLTMFLPLFQIAAGNTNKEPEGIEAFLNTYGVEITLFNILGVMVFFYIVKGIIQYFKIKYETDTARYYMISTRKGLVSSFSKVSFGYYSTADVGRIQNTMTAELQTIYNAFIQYLNILQQFIMICVYMSFAFFLNAQFAVMIIIGGALFNFIFQRIYKVTKHSSRLRVEASNLYQSLIIQFVQNFKYLKATGLLAIYGIKIGNSIDEIETQSRKMGYMNAYAGALREPILIVIVASVILFQVNILGGALATIIVSLLFFYRALTSVTFLQTSINSFNMLIGTLENVESFEKELLQNHEIGIGTQDVSIIGKGLRLSNISFNYGEKQVLKDISINILPKETIAFVGESGSGKTTLVNLITGLLPIQHGSYFVDDRSIAEIDIKQFQSKIGYISQEPVIFNDTIFNNVTFWSEPSQEVLRDYENALKKAEIWNYVEGLSEKSETLLGNNGVNLSGGQKQRISIARELYKKAEILIFDEATSALDSETEKAIQRNIDSLKGQVTMLIIAHRLSTVSNVDQIYLIDGGKVVSHGTFEDMMQISPKFKKMVLLQTV